MASVLEMEDEPDEKDAFNSLQEHARLEELARRNTLCLPHLRSVYPTEMWSADDDVVTSVSKDTSRSSVAAGKSTARLSIREGHAKDFGFGESQSKDSSRSSFVGGHTKDVPSSSGGVEGHFKDVSRSNVVRGDSRESMRSRPSSAMSLPPLSELSGLENIRRRKVKNIITIIIIIVQ